MDSASRSSRRARSRRQRTRARDRTAPIARTMAGKHGLFPKKEQDAPQSHPDARALRQSCRHGTFVTRTRTDQEAAHTHTTTVALATPRKHLRPCKTHRYREYRAGAAEPAAAD